MSPRRRFTTRVRCTMRKYAHIASLPDREDSLGRTINSLYPYVDEIWAMLNNYDHIPSFPDPGNKIHYVSLKNEYGDAAKFLDFDKREGYVFICDDDLTYGHDYVPYMLSRYKYYGNRIITIHGKVYARPVRTVHGGYVKNYHCLSDVRGDHEVDIGGTGVMLINTKDININISDFPYPNMADIWLGKLAHEQGVKIMVVDHYSGIVVHSPPPTTIYHSLSSEANKYQVAVLNSFLVGAPMPTIDKSIPLSYNKKSPQAKKISKLKYMRRRYGHKFS